MDTSPRAVETSSDITSLEEARVYYAAKLSGRRRVTTRAGISAIVNFEAEATHLFSDEVTHDDFLLLPKEERVRRKLPGGRVEYRRFSLDRAKLMDHVLPTIANFVFSIEGLSDHGREKRLLHGAALPDGRFLRVVVSPWRNSPTEWTCVSAYPLTKEKWLTAKRSKAIKFP